MGKTPARTSTKDRAQFLDRADRGEKRPGAAQAHEQPTPRSRAAIKNNPTRAVHTQQALRPTSFVRLEQSAWPDF